VDDYEFDYSTSMSWFDKLRLLAEIGPLLGHLQVAFGKEDAHEQALALIAAAKWAAGRTATPIDDEVLAHVEAILRTTEGRDFFRYTVAKLGVINA